MKKIFSKYWKSSKQPRKQRKYLANAPIHLRKKFLSVNLSKDLRKKYSRRAFPLRKNDVVKVMRGKFKGKKGKILSVDTKRKKIVIEGIQRSKRDGTKVAVKFVPSNLQIQELNLEDKKRIKSVGKENQESEKKETEKENKNKKSFEKNKIKQSKK